MRLVFYDFSDRPQFIAQDAAGRLLYSTRPTSAANTGTVRVVTNQPGWERPESNIIVVRRRSGNRGDDHLHRPRG